jgi:SPP1 family predicted phage head-tail adaptor
VINMVWTKIGDMKHKIIVKHITGYTRDDNGDDIPTWETFFETRAKVEINSGREFYASRKVNAQWDGLFKFLYHPGIKPTMKVFYGTREFNILTVLNPEEANVQTWLECKEVI